MEVIIRPTTESAVKFTARLIADQLRANPKMVLGLATGRTMEAVYAELARMHREEGLDFSQAQSFNLDEYIGLSGDNKNSYRYYMNYHLFNHVNIDKSKTNLPNGMAEDPIAEGERYEAAIKAAGGVDMQLLGIGRDGHIGFNEPGTSFDSVTHVVQLKQSTIEDNARLFFDGKIEDVPTQAISMGIQNIMNAKKVVLIACGENKQEAVKGLIEGPVTTDLPASVLQNHDDVVVIIDEAAAKLLDKEY